MVKSRKVVVNSHNEEVEEGAEDSAVIINLEIAKERGVKLLDRKKSDDKDEGEPAEDVPETTAAVVEDEEPKAKQVDGPAENKARKAPAESKGR